MDDRQSRRLEALSAHVDGLKTALEAAEAENSLESLRRLARSLARAADDAGLPEIAERARAAQAATQGELSAAARALVDFVVAQQPSRGGLQGRRHVLLVEDNPTVATMVLAHLRADDRVLHLAATAEEAERILAEHPVELVILDLILPDRDGRDLLLQLREDPLTASVRVIVLSARAGKVAKAECLAVGASAFLEKPAEPQLLRSTVALQLDEHRRGVDARVDQATGVLSRAGLTESFRSLRSRSGKVEGPPAVALVVIEPVDAILSTMGAPAVDALVRALAEHLRAVLDEREVLGRWSEGTFMALLPGTNPSAGRERVASGIAGLTAAGILRPYDEAGVEVAFSVGVSAADTGVDLREASFASEQALQRMHRKGETVAFATETDETERRPLVLLVEDDRVTATLIQHRLVREGFGVMDFLNGEDAFRWASETPFDLAILDVKVPGMDGFEILERLRAIPRARDVPIIMLTALGGEADVVRGLELGANDYMLKPFSPAELIARVRRLAEKARGR